MSTAPDFCVYCQRGTVVPSSDGRTECGFCVDGVPLDTQADWDRTWGRIFKDDLA